MTQGQLPEKHPGHDMLPPDQCRAWFLKRFDAARPSAWSHAAAGALAFKQDIFEVFITESDAKPASIEAIAQDPFDSHHIIEMKKKTRIGIHDALNDADKMQPKNHPGILPSFG